LKEENGGRQGCIRYPVKYFVYKNCLEISFYYKFFIISICELALFARVVINLDTFIYLYEMNDEFGYCSFAPHVGFFEKLLNHYKVATFPIAIIRGAATTL
jgi:hypothetical protein